MTSPTSPQNSPLTARLYDLEYPRSLGVYSTYAEVQTVVDALADKEFPVQHTMIVGTDLKLVERVTGRKTWGKVIRNGVLSGLWMGLFMGLLFVLITNQSLLLLLTTVVMGIVFFTVWAVIGYATTGGKRDFTSMTATIPMQYELMVEHSHAMAAREILVEQGTATPPAGMRRPRTTPAAALSQAQHPGVRQGEPPSAGIPQAPVPAAQDPSAQNTSAQDPLAPHSYGRAADQTSPSEGRSRRPSYGRPASPAVSSAPSSDPSASRRRTFGQPATGAPSTDRPGGDHAGTGQHGTEQTAPAAEPIPSAGSSEDSADGSDVRDPSSR